MNNSRQVTALLTVHFEGHTYDLSHIADITPGEVVHVEPVPEGLQVGGVLVRKLELFP